ncbi:AAA family ATPase [Pseudalkalibacillus caeni]|uniref:AAA family ATPase n=1 Tax=Exobacillus caeni TaxID=2574798 RepID=UPI001485360C|nr:AAA family ATPase [Pseudalkalibacillus caeni]
MIDSFSLKQVATYDEFGINLTDLKKINFIYGANGSGKTTISNFLFDPDHVRYNHSSLNWKNHIPVNILVYNKAFRDKNFGKGNIDGVFTLGEATKEEIKHIEKQQNELGELKNKLVKKKETLDKQIEQEEQFGLDFREKVWKGIYKKYEKDFKEAFSGVMRKEAFMKKIIEEFQSNNAKHLSYDELKNRSKTIFGKVPETLSIIQQIDFKRILEIESNNIWIKKIIGKSDIEIGKFIQNLNLNDWVNEGRNFIQDDTCPFCQQNTITSNFKKQLEDYFDESFTNHTNLVKSYKEEYNRLAVNLINFLQQIETKEKNNPDSKLDIETFTSYLKTLTSQFTTNKEKQNNKNKEPSRIIELISVKDQLESIQKIIIDANDRIKKHNDIVANYAVERNNLTKEIWKYIIGENNGDIEDFIKKSNGLQNGIDSLRKQFQDLRKQYIDLEREIKTATQNMTSIQPSIDQINLTLNSFGFENFQIDSSETENNQYQIRRKDGSLAESTLSEGEVTFITFLYFLQLAKGSTDQDSITDERILVIDDPISSLDSNVLFIVSSLLKEIIKSIKKDEGNIKQLMLLTHNVYFHKEVSFIDGRTKECGDTYYWILRKNNNVSTLQKFETKNPIQNSYELLWQELKSKNNISIVTVQNIMRRIIENYFKLLGKYGDEDLIKEFPSKQEQEICRSLIYWINEGSHTIPDDLYVEHPEATNEKYFKVFERIFFYMGHYEHYKMMMGIQDKEKVKELSY